MNFLKRGINLPLLVGLVLIGGWPMVFGSSYDLRVFTLAGIYAMLGVHVVAVFKAWRP